VARQHYHDVGLSTGTSSPQFTGTGWRR
jgi:hypothetical protein